VEQRPLTQAQRDTLSKRALLFSAFELAWNTGMTSFAAVCGAGAVLLLASVATLGGMHAERSTINRTLLAIVVVTMTLAVPVTAIRLAFARAKEAAAQAKVDADLAGGVATVERVRATNALRAILLKRERAYFLRLEDGRTLYVGYWNPPEHDNPGALGHPPESEAFPSTEVEVARGPSSGVYLGAAPCGAPLPPSKTFECRFRDAAPQPGDVIPQPWESIPRFFS
jgi:hypothetical protein